MRRRVDDGGLRTGLGRRAVTHQQLGRSDRRRVVAFGRVSLLPPEPIRVRRTRTWAWTVAWEWPEHRRPRGASSDPGADRRGALPEGRASPATTPPRSTRRTACSGRRVYLPVPDVLDARIGRRRRLAAHRPRSTGTDATRHPLLADPARIVPILARGLADVPRAPRPSRRARSTSAPAAAIAHVRRRVRDGIAKPDRPASRVRAPHARRRAPRARTARAGVGGPRRVPRRLLLPQRACSTTPARSPATSTSASSAVADRWWDVAVGAWSTTWNVGPGWEELFYESYGIEPDADRIRFYRLLYDLAS